MNDRPDPRDPYLSGLSVPGRRDANDSAVRFDPHGRRHTRCHAYLKLSVAGHLTVFLTRTQKLFYSDRPATVLLLAVLGTQLIATFMAVYGLLMTPLGWSWALFVWGYALVWFLINDRVKLAAYRIFGKYHSGLILKKRR